MPPSPARRSVQALGPFAAWIATDVVPPASSAGLVVPAWVKAAVGALTLVLALTLLVRHLRSQRP